MSLPLFAIPGPCTTFDGTPAPAAPQADAGDAAASDAGDAAPSGPRPYLSIADAVKVCSLVERCPSLPYSIGLSLAVPIVQGQFVTCVHTLASPVPPSRLGFELQRGVLARIAAARTCQEALDATPTELLYGADPRCPAAGSPSGCRDGAHAVFCGDSGYGTYSTCVSGHGGASCLEVDVPDGGGRFGVCGTGTCDQAVPESRCEGTTVVTCDPRQYKLATAFDCAWLGLACGRVADTVFTCVTPGGDQRCPGFPIATCNGDEMRFCVASDAPRWSTFECGEIGATCAGGMRQDGSGPPPFCLKKGAKCSPQDAELGGCAGSAIDLCVDGALTQFDCARVGKQCDRAARACL
jgi:hypothetical protein